MQALYRLRWRFEFLDGKAPRSGLWSMQERDSLHGAWSVNKSNLAFALVQYECLRTQKVGVFAECAGPDFVNFEWIGQVVVRPLTELERSTYSPTILGLQLVTRDLVLKVFVDGTHQVHARSEEDKKRSLVGFGK
jgi:hypothetical protein